jgi:hypothetical protein
VFAREFLPKIRAAKFRRKAHRSGGLLYHKYPV